MKKTKLVATLVVREDYEGIAMAEVDELWSTSFFKGCKKPLWEACGDFAVCTYTIWDSKDPDRTIRRIKLLRALDFNIKRVEI